MATPTEGAAPNDGCCWVCQDEGNARDVIQPCRCRLHRQCIQNWVVHVSPDSRVM